MVAAAVGRVRRDLRAAGLGGADAPAPAPEPVAATSASGRYGPGSADAAEDGSGPEGHPIKGNTDSMLYHDDASPNYGRTRAEVWFATAEHAEAAGFRRWDVNRG